MPKKLGLFISFMSSDNCRKNSPGMGGFGFTHLLVQVLFSYLLISKASANTQDPPPHVVVAGGGPAGLLTALLLGRRGINVSVLEVTQDNDKWNNRSYFISLNARGQVALASAGLLDRIKKESIPLYGFRRLPHDLSSPEPPRAESPSAILGISRPKLIRCLADALLEEGNARLLRGAGVVDLVAAEPGADGPLRVVLSDRTVLRATHVVGADGKWSAVRAAAARLEAGSPGGPSFAAALRAEKYWGIRLRLDSPLADYAPQPGWAALLEPLTETAGARALLTHSDGPEPYVPWLVLYEPILARYPELAPPAEAGKRLPEPPSPSPASTSAPLKLAPPPFLPSSSSSFLGRRGCARPGLWRRESESARLGLPGPVR